MATTNTPSAARARPRASARASRRTRPPRRRFTIRLGSGDCERLAELAAEHGLAPAAVARLAVHAGLARVARGLSEGRELGGW